MAPTDIGNSPVKASKKDKTTSPSKAKKASPKKKKKMSPSKKNEKEDDDASVSLSSLEDENNNESGSGGGDTNIAETKVSPTSGQGVLGKHVSINEDGDIIVNKKPTTTTQPSSSPSPYLKKLGVYENDEFTKLLQRKVCSCADPNCKAMLKRYYLDDTAPYPGRVNPASVIGSGRKKKKFKYEMGSTGDGGDDEDNNNEPTKLLLINVPNPHLKLKEGSLTKRAKLQCQFYDRACDVLSIPNSTTRRDINVAMHHFPREVIERYRLNDNKGKTKFKDALLPQDLVIGNSDNNNNIDDNDKNIGSSKQPSSSRLGREFTPEDKFNCLGTSAEQRICSNGGTCNCNVYINVPFVTLDMAKAALGQKVVLNDDDLRKFEMASVNTLRTGNDESLQKKKKVGGDDGKKNEEEDTPKAKEKREKKAAFAGIKRTHQMYEVTVPGGVEPGQTFSLVANGKRVTLICPESAKPGVVVRFQLLIEKESEGEADKDDKDDKGEADKDDKETSNKENGMFEVVVPEGVKPRESFSLVVEGQRVTLQCPAGALPGQTIRFQLPVAKAIHDGKLNDCKTCKLAKSKEAFRKGQWNRYPLGSGECKACKQKEIARIAAMPAKKLCKTLTKLEEDNAEWKKKCQKAIAERSQAVSKCIQLERELRAANKQLSKLTKQSDKLQTKLTKSEKGKKQPTDAKSGEKRSSNVLKDGTPRKRSRSSLNPDGTMKPASQPKLLEDGMYKKPGSKPPSGKNGVPMGWCCETGLWIPQQQVEGGDDQV